MATVALTASAFPDTVESGTVFVDFWAAWCSPCLVFGPIYEHVSEQNPDVVFAKVDVEAEPAIGERYSIRAIPTLMAFRDGVPVFRHSGALPVEVLQSLVDRVRAFDVEAAAEAAPSSGARPTDPIR